MRVALLEDDQAQREALVDLVSAAGYTCRSFSASRSLITALRRESFDLLILDWNVPDLPGVEVLAWVRANLDPAPPCLLLTSRQADEDIIAGLNAGADDYVAKPLQPSVLLARVNALLRRAYPAPRSPDVERFGDYAFSPAGEGVTIGAQSVALTSKEFCLALLLFRNLHRALSRAYLLEAVWGRNPDLPTRTLDIHISKIRSKLAIRPERGFRLTSVYSYGYRLERLANDTDLKALS
jgi:DNA-binding response OmpR family regulator